MAYSPASQDPTAEGSLLARSLSEAGQQGKTLLQNKTTQHTEQHWQLGKNYIQMPGSYGML